MFDIKNHLSLLAAMLLLMAGLTGPLPAQAGDAEAQAIATCAASSADAISFGACTAGTLTANEAQKCFASNFNDCFGRGNTIRQLLDKTVAGPVQDLLDGDIGRSGESVWRKAGLPRVKLW